MTAAIHHFDAYDRAYAQVRKATDWPTKLGYAHTLAASPMHKHNAMARHIRTAYSLHLAGLLKPVDPSHRDRSDMVDGWKATHTAAKRRPSLASLAVVAGAGWTVAMMILVALQ